MKVLLTHTFKRAAKKLHPQQRMELEKAIQTIIANTQIGNLKLGDLSGIRVYKFHLQTQLILLAYSLHQEKKQSTLTLISFAPHENFYTNLKKQLKN